MSDEWHCRLRVDCGSCNLVKGRGDEIARQAKEIRRLNDRRDEIAREKDKVWADSVWELTRHQNEARALKKEIERLRKQLDEANLATMEKIQRIAELEDEQDTCQGWEAKHKNLETLLEATERRSRDLQTDLLKLKIRVGVRDKTIRLLERDRKMVDEKSNPLEKKETW